MKNTRMFKRFLMVAIPLAIVAPAWASIGVTPCPGSPTPLSTIPVTGPTNGCVNGNLQFNNFVVGPDATGTIAGVTLATTNWLTPPDATTINLNVDTGGIDLTSLVTCGTPTANITGKTFCVGGNPSALVSSVTYDLHSTSGLISLLELDGTVFTHSSGKTGAIATIFREFCLGTTVFSQGCGGYGSLRIGTLNGQNQTLSQSASATFAGVTDIAIRDTVFLQTFGPTGEYAGITTFALFAPEPATFGLVGLALAGLGALRFRKRKL